MLFWRETTSISEEEEIKIDMFLRSWHRAEIESRYLYHGTSAFYEEIIKRKGLNPKKHQYEKRMIILFKIFKKIKNVYPRLIHKYLKWHSLFEGTERLVYFTLNKELAIRQFLGKNLGGEVLRFSLWSIDNIKNEYDKSGRIIRLLISKREMRFLDSFKKWAIRVQGKRGILLVVRMDCPSFNSGSWLSKDDSLFAPMGDYNNFKDSLKKFFRKEKLEWSFQSVKLFFSDKQITDKWDSHGWPCKYKIKPEDIEMEYF